MAADAGDLIVLAETVSGDRFGQVAVASPARFLGHAAISFGDLDRFVKVIESKVIRVPKTVRGLGRVLADQIVRRVAVVTRRNVFMAAFLPTVQLFFHDVTIGASHRVVAQIGIAFRIDESEQSAPDRQSDGDTDNSKFYSL